MKLLNNTDLYFVIPCGCNVTHSDYMKKKTLSPIQLLVMNHLGSVCVFLDPVCLRKGQKGSESFAVVAPPPSNVFSCHSSITNPARRPNVLFIFWGQRARVCVWLQNDPLRQTHRTSFFLYNYIITARLVFTLYSTLECIRWVSKLKGAYITRKHREEISASNHWAAQCVLRSNSPVTFRGAVYCSSLVLVCALYCIMHLLISSGSKLLMRVWEKLNLASN